MKIDLAKLIGFGTEAEKPVFREPFEYTPMNYAEVLKEFKAKEGKK